MVILRKSLVKIFIATVLIFATLACGQKETPTQPKEQEYPTAAAFTALFKKWDDAFNKKNPDKLMEIIPDEVKNRLPEESKAICKEMVNELAL